MLAAIGWEVMYSFRNALSFISLVLTESLCWASKLSRSPWISGAATPVTSPNSTARAAFSGSSSAAFINDEAACRRWASSRKRGLNASGTMLVSLIWTYHKGSGPGHGSRAVLFRHLSEGILLHQYET